MVAIQYSPYNMGGDIIWVKNKENIEIPVVTAKFSIWSGLFDNPLCGGPDYVAALINRDAAKASKQKIKRIHYLGQSYMPGRISVKLHILIIYP